MAGYGQPRFAARTGMRRPGIGRWLILALLLQAALALVDITASDEVIFTTTFVLAPFALAVSGHARATAAMGVVAIVLAIASGYWNDYAGSTDHLLRITIVASGSILATLAAAALERAGEQRARMTVLAAVGRITGADAARGRRRGPRGSARPGRRGRLLDRPGSRRASACSSTARAAPPDAHSGPARLFDGNTRALVPLSSADSVIGHLGLTTTYGRYDRDDLAFFEIVADRVALVLANAAAGHRPALHARPPRRHPQRPGRGRDGQRRRGPDDLRQRRRDDAAGPDDRRRGHRRTSRRARRALRHHQGERRTGRRRRLPGPAAGRRRARPGDADPQRRQGHRPGLLAADEGDAAARPGPRLRDQHHRGRHERQGVRAAPALPRPRRPAAGLEPRLRADAQARRRARRAVAGRLVRRRPAGRQGRDRAGRARARRPGQDRDGRGAAPPLPARPDGHHRRPRRPARRAGRADRRDPRRAARRRPSTTRSSSRRSARSACAR